MHVILCVLYCNTYHIAAYCIITGIVLTLPNKRYCNVLQNKRSVLVALHCALYLDLNKTCIHKSPPSNSNIYCPTPTFYHFPVWDVQTCPSHRTTEHTWPTLVHLRTAQEFCFQVKIDLFWKTTRNMYWWKGSEREIKFIGLLGDIQVHLVHMSRVIITYTLE